MRERCKNDNLVSIKAKLLNYSRIFCSHSDRWSGAVASILPIEGSTCYGSIVYLNDEELSILDGYEGCKTEDPYADTNLYKRVHCDLVVYDQDGKESIVKGIAYQKIDTTWKGEPSKEYVDACLRNIKQFWTKAEGVALDVVKGTGEKVKTFELD